MDFLHSIFGQDLYAAGSAILSLILIESLLSVDNAAVLATMVRDLPKEQQDKALKYGIIGAYVFRGICLLLVNHLMKIIWLKGVGGLYLVYLTYDYFKSKATPETDDDTLNKNQNFLYKFFIGKLGVFWTTVILVEVMDLAFSIDNIFAAASLSNNIYVICIGVFIGILAMRFVAQGFVKLMHKYPFLETSAFVVIGFLGVKLVISFVCDQFFKDEACECFKDSKFCEVVNGHSADWYASIITLLIFVVPIFTSMLFNFPRREAKKD